MEFDGTNIANYGFNVIKADGHLDMPARLTPFVYDWGDEVQPLFDDGFFAFGGRTITVDVIYNPSLQTEPLVTNYFDLKTRGFPEVDMELRMTESNGTNGIYTVRMVGMEESKLYRGDKKIVKFQFEQQSVSFIGTLPAAGGGNLTLGGYNLKEFGIKIIEVKGLHDVPKLKVGSNTVYNTNTEYSDERELQTFSLSCICVGDSPQDLLVKMDLFHVLLSTQGLMNFSYNGLSFNVFCSSGISAKKNTRKSAIFELKLNRIP